MIEAIWGTEYDMHTDKCYECPVCKECYAPILKHEDGKYRCVSCGEEARELTDGMKAWLVMQEEVKTEYRDCFPAKTKDGSKGLGCGGKNCMEVHYVRNMVTLEWQTAWGKCKNCGASFIV